MPARSPRSRAALLAAGFVAVAAIGIGIGYAVRGSGSGSSGRASSSSSSASASPSSASSSSAGAPASTIVPPTTVATAGLQGDAAELAAAINKAAGL
ncbi:MAG: hypothetical protein QOE63_1058, partial [Acidimicrobiaceae bacterium]